MDVNIKVLRTIGNTNGRHHQSSMHYWQYKWTSSSKFYALLAIPMNVKIKVIRTIDNTNGRQHQRFYALLAIQMDVNIKVLCTVGNTYECQHQSSMHYYH